jgi:divalent metal cation (Fe/Co/Zn/Cd) transporter
MHLLVPGEWSVTRAHDLAEQLESEIRQQIPTIAVFTHVEPIDDPVALDDDSLDRK